MAMAVACREAKERGIGAVRRAGVRWMDARQGNDGEATVATATEGLMLAMELAVALVGAESESKRCVGIGRARRRRSEQRWSVMKTRSLMAGAC